MFTGSYDVPRFYSGRIVFLLLYIGSLFIYQFYSASIVGSLLAESPRFIRTVHDLLGTSMEIGIEDVGYNHNFLRVSENLFTFQKNSCLHLNFNFCFFRYLQTTGVEL